eukprot:COSAG05_NODE_10209_length_577_cov_2.320084_1_plen_47_part_10
MVNLLVRSHTTSAAMEKFANPLSEEAESYDETALGESAAADDTGKPS